MTTTKTDYVWSKDRLGRDIVTPTFNVQERKWDKAREAFGHTIALPSMEQLTPYHRDLIDRLARGQSNALLYGRAGTGKTTVAMIALRELCMAGKAVMGRRFSVFKSQMEPRFQEENSISSETVLFGYHLPEYLLIDELGFGEYRAATTEHERRVLFDLVSPRHSQGKKTWLLSNLDRDALFDLYGEAVLSRIDAYGECVTADFAGQPNFRLEKK